ncbi:unnamed protein product [Lymnaea stagnalis]|uniref:AAA+ ATPase domain-containing protein n=1 Tax=Lymnaea stagnalis TaxID=6523 RepID=A0AAV2HJV7_LYMST
MSRGQLNTKGKSMNGASRLALLKEFEVLADVMKKDTRADEGENRVISALEILSHRYGPMFIICGYQYNNYLNKLREEMFSKGEASRPVRAFGQTMRAEHDCLIFHKNYGAIIVCIKAIGDNFSDWNASEEDRISSTNKILGKAIKQLEREEAMIHHVTSDLMKLKCHKLIALPNMTRDDVMKALAKDQKLLKSINDLTNNLGADLFLCQDELSDKKVSIWDLPEEKTRRLARWWELVSGTLMSEADFIEAKVYRQIIGRYCGLLSTVEVWSPSNPRVEVRSISEAVDLCGKRFAKVVLLPHQVEVLCSNHKRLFLYGPPGSGKTLLLILKAREWLISGKTVILLNVRPGSIHGFPYAYGVFDRLKKMVAPFRVPITNLRMVNIDTLKFQSDALASVLPTWCVIMDEVTPAAHQVIEHLSCLQVQHIWCAGVFTDDRPITAHRFFACKMDKILRCPPIVQTVMKHTEEDVRLSKPYEQLYQSNSLHFSMEKQSLGSNRFSETDKENAKEKSILSVPQAKSCLTEREGNIKTICEEPDKCGKSGPDVVSSKSAVKFEEEELKYDPDLLNERLMSRYGRKSLSLQEKNLKEDELKMPQNLSWYSTSSVDLGLATDGPRPHIIDHQSHTQPGLPLDCPKCAEELAKFLLSMVKQDAFSSEKEPRSQPSKNKYAFKNTGGASSKGGRVGRETTIFSNASTIHMKTPSIMSFGSKLFDNKALTWSDVLIVANDVDQECPLVSGLRNRGIPVEVVRGSQAHKIETSRTPTLFVTTYKEVNGLERSLIIFVPSEVPDELHKKKETPDLLDLQLGHCIKRFTDKDRTALWYVASRSLSSLVLMLP